MAIHHRRMRSKNMQRCVRIMKKVMKHVCFDENMGNVNWPRMRRILNLGYGCLPKEKGVRYHKIRLGNQRALLTEYGCPERNHIILYIHGGAFVSGSAYTSKSYCSMLAKYSGCRVIAVEYSLAPEHPFPEGFHDCYEAYREITGKFPHARVTLVGESAGGNLCVALALKVKRSRRIACVIAHSPNIDFSGVLDRSKNKISDFIVKAGCSKPLHDFYIKGRNPKNPYISPLYGDFRGFPPTFVTCDRNETLNADAVALYKKCVAAGVPAELVEVKGGFHAFALAGSRTPETKRILEENIQFMRKYS